MARCFFWFLLLGYLATDLIGQMLICMLNHSGLKRAALPEWTKRVIYMLPEHPLSVLAGALFASIGFAFVCSAHNEAMSSRLFRWIFIAVLTALLGLALPVIEMRTCLCSGPRDTTWMDEALAVAVGITAMLVGRRYAKDHA